MDLRYEFDQILAQYGSDVLLVRTDAKLRCSCWNEKKQEADRLCPICFGMGFVPTIEKHTARSQWTGPNNSLAVAMQQGQLGDMNVVGRQYYFRHTARVKEQCLIVEVDWSATGKPIYNGGGIFEIQNVDRKVFEHGQVAFQKVMCKDEPVQKQIRGIRIANVNGVINYEIAVEGGLG
jgi:hypothetical protein